MSHYTTLDISKSASQGEIKSAYRKMTIRWHPDKNQGSKAAEEKFKKVADAYSVLSDPEKRKVYDRPAPSGLSGQAQRQQKPFSGWTPTTSKVARDLFYEMFKDSDFFARMFGEQVHQIGEDIELEVSITINIVAFGAKGMPIVYSRRVRCPKCTNNAAMFCITCNRSKMVRVDQKLNVNIPAGIKGGGTATVKGMGHQVQFGTKGNLIMTIKEEPNPEYERLGNDICSNLYMSTIDMANGGVVTVKTLHGSTKMRIKPGTKTGKTYRLSGRGIKSQKTGKFGNMYIKVLAEQIEKYQANGKPQI